MPHDEGMLVEHRVVLHFRTRLEVRPNGHHRLFVETLGGDTIEVFDGATLADVEHQLKHDGFQRIPPGIADELDMFRMDHLPLTFLLRRTPRS